MSNHGPKPARLATPDVSHCSRCSEACHDFRQRDGERVCILCVEQELQAANRMRAEDRKTFADFDRVLTAHGFDPEDGTYDCDWLEARLERLAMLERVGG